MAQISRPASTPLWRNDSDRARAGLRAALALQFAGAAAAASPADVVQNCAAGAPAATRGLTELERVCPGLAGALDLLGEAPLLRDTGTLTPLALGDLAALGRRYAGGPPGGGPAVAPVAAIAREVSKEHAPVRSWWDAVKEWVRSLLQRQQPQSQAWLVRWLERLARAAGGLKILIGALLAAVLAAAGVLLVREWQRARAVSGRAASGPGVAAHDGTARSGGGLSSRDSAAALLDGAAVPERPALLLHLLVSALARCGRLSGDRPLTHRELIERARLESAADRARFADVATLAEGLMYGAARRDGPAIEAAVDAGRELLSELERRDIRR